MTFSNIGLIRYSIVKTIEAYEKDIQLQVSALSKFKPPALLSNLSQMYSIFCGSGDSLAAALLAEAFSELRVKAADPLDLLKNESILKSHDVFVVSISGRTISNVNVAKLARRSYGITSNVSSKLAKTCDGIIPLRFPNNDVFTAGSISFLDSALTCISLVKKFKIQYAKTLFSSAVLQSKKAKLTGNVYFLGNLHTYPVAMYGAAKLFEILGATAFYEKIEQFSHMELFSVSKGDTVIIFEEKTPHNISLVKELKKIGLNVIQPDPGTNDKVLQVIFYTFFSQLVPLFIAKKKNQKECHFVLAKKIRAVSDKMIY